MSTEPASSLPVGGRVRCPSCGAQAIVTAPGSGGSGQATCCGLALELIAGVRPSSS